MSRLFMFSRSRGAAGDFERLLGTSGVSARGGEDDAAEMEKTSPFYLLPQVEPGLELGGDGSLEVMADAGDGMVEG